MSLQEILERLYKLEYSIEMNAHWDIDWEVFIFNGSTLVDRYVEHSLEECRAWLEKKLGALNMR